MAEGASPHTGAIVAFGPFRLVPAQQLVLDGDRQLALGSRAFDILMALVARAGEVVSKAELIASAWPDTFVEKSNLHNLVYQLREALDDQEHSIIRTAYGFGFSFGPDVDRDVPQSRPPL